MVYKDYWALTQWYQHHGKMLGHQNLYVVAHGADPRIAKICPKASIITVPRDDLSNFDARRSELLNGIRRGLHSFYDWMIQCDADELICFDRSKYRSMAELLENQKDGPVLAALGLNLVEVEGDEPLGSDPIFTKRRNVVVSGHYSKACVTSTPVRFKRHGVELRRGQVEKYPFVLAKSLYLVHLKYANIKALMRADRIRQDVANREGEGLPGDAWRKPSDANARIFNRFADLELVDWKVLEPAAYDELSKSSLRAGKGVVRIKPVHFKQRTQLPKWFQRL